MSKNYTDDELQKYDPVTINNGKTPIGYVAEVINKEKTGEQAYIITDGNPAT